MEGPLPGFICHKWSEYCPILFGYSSEDVPRTQSLFAFSRVTKKWDHLPLRLSIAGPQFKTNFVRIVGPFLVQMYSYVPPELRESRPSSQLPEEIALDERVRVANLFTGEVVELPPGTGIEAKLRLNTGRVLRKLVVSGGFDIYQLVDVAFSCDSAGFRVVMVYRNDPTHIERLALVEYSSSSGVWKHRVTPIDWYSNKTWTVSTALCGGKSLLTIGVLPTRISKYELDERAPKDPEDGEDPETGWDLEEVVCSGRIETLWRDIYLRNELASLVWVGEKLMAVTVDMENNAWIHEVNEETLEVMEVSCQNLEELLSIDHAYGLYSWNWGWCGGAGGQSIFFRPHNGAYVEDILVYDVREKTWEKRVIKGREGSWGWMFVLGSTDFQCKNFPSTWHMGRSLEEVFAAKLRTE